MKWILFLIILATIRYHEPQPIAFGMKLILFLFYNEPEPNAFKMNLILFLKKWNQYINKSYGTSCI